MDRLTVTGTALPELAAAVRAAAAASDPVPLAAACAQAVAALGPLMSAPALAELAVQLVRAVSALQVRWWAMVTALGAAAERYAALEAAIVQAVGPDAPGLLPPGGGAGSLPPGGGS